AIMLGKKVAACVMYYGMPESNAVKLKNICPVLGIFGNDDTRITPKIVDRFQTIMQQVNQTLVVYRYDAKADFANPYNTNHHVEATNQAYNQTISFIKKMLLQMPAH
ncbi:MAG TPA: dienelactone hydrolase family protein, partial [Bacteroidia bacterium]|nr:dienelactone hydrolase family protein [Bacteroidia bacterium]